MGERQAARSCPLELVDSGDRSLVLHFVDALLPTVQAWGAVGEVEGERGDSGYGKGREQKRPQIRTDQVRGLGQVLTLMLKHLHHPWVMAA